MDFEWDFLEKLNIQMRIFKTDFEGDILEYTNIQMRMYLMDIKEDILEYWEEDPGNVTDIKEDIFNCQQFSSEETVQKIPGEGLFCLSF